MAGPGWFLSGATTAAAIVAACERETAIVAWVLIYFFYWCVLGKGGKLLSLIGGQGIPLGYTGVVCPKVKNVCPTACHSDSAPGSCTRIA